ncbi:MAG: diguanylate cyclase [Shewanella sp.]
MQQPNKYQTTLMLSVIFGVIGLILNLFPIPLFANVQLIFGNTALVIIAVLAGPWFALLTAMLCALGLFLSWGNWFIFVFLAIEAIVLGFARRKNIYILYASMLFWLLLAPVIFYCYTLVFTQLPISHLPFILLKQAINGLLYTAIAALILLVWPYLYQFDRFPYHPRRSFNSHLTYIFCLIITAALLISTLFLNYSHLHQQQQLLLNKLSDSLNYQYQTLEHSFEDHYKSLSTMALWLGLSAETTDAINIDINQLVEHNADYLTLKYQAITPLIMDTEPASLLQSKSNSHIPGGEAEKPPSFIQETTRLDKLTLTIDVIAQQDKQLLGHLLATFNLPQMFTTNIESANQPQPLVIITDAKGYIIYSSPSLTLPLLSPLKYRQSGEGYSTPFNMINLHDLSTNAPEYIYLTRSFDNGLRLMVLQPFEPLLMSAQQLYLYTFGFLWLAIALAMSLAGIISRIQTRPLELISRCVTNKDTQNIKVEFTQHTPIEVISLYEQISLNQQELLAHQLALEEQVTIRTLELKQANDKLQQLATQDGLTQLSNRRHGEQLFIIAQEYCQRSQENLAVILLDLDHFKTVNDTYGHLAGDQCLRQVSVLLKQHFRRETDILARYGGEEFLIILSGYEQATLIAHLEHFREQIEQLSIHYGAEAPFKVTASIGGFNCAAKFGSALDKWLSIADENLYQAKKQGRNQVICTGCHQLTLCESSIA